MYSYQKKLGTVRKQSVCSYTEEDYKILITPVYFGLLLEVPVIGLYHEK